MAIHGTVTNSVRDGGFARQPCRMGGTIYSFSCGKNVLSNAKHFSAFLPCNMADVQNLCSTYRENVPSV